jgi:hypothetical protein
MKGGKPVNVSNSTTPKSERLTDMRLKKSNGMISIGKRSFKVLTGCKPELQKQF